MNEWCTNQNRRDDHELIVEVACVVNILCLEGALQTTAAHAKAHGIEMHMVCVRP